MNAEMSETPAAGSAGANPDPADASSGSTGSDLPQSFEQAVAELESLVQAMESGTLALEDSLEAYRRGVRLAARCRSLLADVQQQVRVLEADLLKPFDLGPESD